MTRSNRVLNRLILILLGLLAVGAAVLLALPAVAATEFGKGLPLLTQVFDASRVAGAEDGGGLGPVILSIVVAAAAVVIILSLVWILTRGRGRSASAYEHDSVSVDVKVVDQLMTDALRPVSDIVSVSTSGHRVRGTSVLRARVNVRPGADLQRVRAAIDSSVEHLDTTLGASVPMLVHITTGLRASLAREERTV